MRPPSTRVSTSEAVRAGPARRGAMWRGRVFAGALALTLLLALGDPRAVAGDDRDRGVAGPLGAVALTSSDRRTSSSHRGPGVRQGLIGSLILIAFVGVVAVPLGVGAAIYLQEYARPTRVNRVLVANIRNLAGVPSIVYGILGLVVFVQALRPITGPGSYGRSYISGGLTLAVLVMPIVILDHDGGAAGGPRSIREAAYGVGATRWEVVRSHVLPYAAPGMFTGVILSLARAFGETAPLLLVGAVTGLSEHAERSEPRSRCFRVATRRCRR